MTKKELISNLQNAIWKLDAAKELLEDTFPSKTEEEISEMFSGTIDGITAKIEIAMNAVYESKSC